MISLKQLLTEKRTPWGMSDSEQDYGNGIKFYGTPSHGGFYVPSNLVNKIDPAGRAYAKKWSGSENWYEEDIGWLWVVVAFPQLFKPEEVAGAKKTIAKYGPNGERLKEEVEIHKLSKADQQATGQKFYFSTDDGYWGYANSKEEAEAMAQGGRKQDRARDRRALKGSYKKEGWNADQWKKAMDRTNKWKQANPALANAKRAAKEKDAPWLRKQKPLPVPAKEGVESGYTKKALMRGPDGMYVMCPCGQKVTISGEKNVCGCGTEFNATGWIKNPKMTEAGDPMSTYKVIERPSANRFYVVDGKGNPAGFWEYKGERSRENARKAAEKKAAEWTEKHSPSSYGLGDKPTIASLEKEALTVPEKHQLKIARDTLKMNPAMAGVMGGPTPEEAKKIIARLSKKEGVVKEAQVRPQDIGPALDTIWNNLEQTANQLEDFNERMMIYAKDKDLLLKSIRTVRIARDYLRALAEKY